MSCFKINSATELWQKETSLPSIPTFSQSLDNVLGNDGVQLCSLTELLGLPGTGKTQLCMQLCASVQIPKILGGLDAEAVYIDTNTNFTVERFRDILCASLSKCQRLLDTPTPIKEDDALQRLHYINAFGLVKFCAALHGMRSIVEEHPEVVVTNEMSTRVGLSTGAVVGSLGDAWAHRCNKRVVLSSEGADRLALCLKSNTGPNTVGRFRITKEGIRDVE